MIIVIVSFGSERERAVKRERETREMNDEKRAGHEKEDEEKRRMQICNGRFLLRI